MHRQQDQQGGEVYTSATVVVADDNATIRLLVTSGLELAGCSVIEVARGDEALDAILAGGVDVLVLDLHMPGMDGAEVVNRIRAREAEESRSPVRILLLTGAESEDLLTALAAGADEYLTKPFHPDDLTQRVGHMLESRRP